jgi:DNA mismatch repair protein MutS
MNNSNTNAAAIIPNLSQFKAFKAQYPSYVLFFRVGEFYELYNEDAGNPAGLLDLVITTRGETRVAAFRDPAQTAINRHLRTLIAAGYKVAICEAVTDKAEKAKHAGDAETLFS